MGNYLVCYQPALYEVELKRTLLVVSEMIIVSLPLCPSPPLPFPPLPLPQNDCMKLALLCTQLATEFLFNVGFRTKRNLRGAANDWVEPLMVFLGSGVRVRDWFANYGLLRHPPRLSEYLLECPSPEVRHTGGCGVGLHVHS